MGSQRVRYDLTTEQPTEILDRGDAFK